MDSPLRLAEEICDLIAIIHKGILMAIGMLQYLQQHIQNGDADLGYPRGGAKETSPAGKSKILNPFRPEEKLIIYLDSSFVRTRSDHEKTAYWYSKF